MSKPNILLQLDSDPQPSVFDSIVAADVGVAHVLRHGGIVQESVGDLVHGAMFTRGPDDLKHTAVFVGGSDVAAGEHLLKAVTESFFGPVRVSVMLDSSGANTTSAAAVLTAGKHMELKGAAVAVLASTGPVGRRILRLLAREGAHLRAASRTLDRAQDVCADIATEIEGAVLTPHAIVSPDGLDKALDGAQIVIAAGAPGVQLLAASQWKNCRSLKVAIDLSAVPPPGIEGIEPTDKAKDRGGVTCYGAIGVGGTKMKIHKAAIRRLFESNDQVLDAEEIYALAGQLGD